MKCVVKVRRVPHYFSSINEARRFCMRTLKNDQKIYSLWITQDGTGNTVMGQVVYDDIGKYFEYYSYGMVYYKINPDGSLGRQL